MADIINIVGELNTIDSMGNNIVNKFSADWDNITNKPPQRSHMVGEEVRFPAQLTLQEQSEYRMLPMDGRELQDVDPYKSLYVFLSGIGTDVIENRPEFTYIQY